ncbi:SDR family NAD(P)-dependent oxidoreductase, partial [Micromonospora sp. ATCC 39149]|uniref:SDR family NAD(P)-dependent oxidoreductase n=1 Tax=Micromonospora sp. (strain ATCC 39149 / NRRL 15099 / SCC 1413) TaxID=219305 RepID=UPI0018DD7EB9
MTRRPSSAYCCRCSWACSTDPTCAPSDWCTGIPAIDGTPSPRHAAVAALLRSAMQEDRRLSARTVEVVGAPDRAALLAELDRAGAVEVRHEHGRRLVRRLVEEEYGGSSEARPGEPAGVIRLRHGGVYLITGGVGGVGAHLATHLARTVDARLVLVGRSATGDPERIAALERTGAEVLYLSGNVSRLEDVTRIVATVRERFGRIDGVVHAAGVLRDGFLRG